MNASVDGPVENLGRRVKTHSTPGGKETPVVFFFGIHFWDLEPCSFLGAFMTLFGFLVSGFEPATLQN